MSENAGQDGKKPIASYRRWLVRAAWGLAFVGALFLPELVFDALRQDPQPRDPLAAIEARLSDRYDFPQISGQSLAQMQASPDGVILFDVREPPEYAVSHIAGAIQVSPDISAVDFMAQYASLITGRDVVFYCSVGRRAGRLAARVEKPAAAAGARVHNLSGGIFRWHDERRALVGPDGAPTEQVHQYNRAVGQLMPRPAYGVLPRD